MPLPLPNLDDVTFAGLVAEARARIPAHCPEWTNHNPADPGIMLVELFAWLTEMLVYRANRVPAAHVTAFLQLLGGPTWRPGPDPAEDVRQAVLEVRQPWRAVTSDDYARLAREAMAAELGVEGGRAHCLPGRDLSATTEVGRTTPRPGHVSVILVPPAAGARPAPTADLCAAVAADLEPRRLLTTRHHVVGPVYAGILARVVVRRRADAAGTADELKAAVVKEVAAFLDPLAGGPEGTGWPFGAAVYVSDLYPVIQQVKVRDEPAVASIVGVELKAATDLAVPVLHNKGNLIGLALRPHHLPAATVTADVEVPS